MKKILRQYRFAIVVLIAFAAVFWHDVELGGSAAALSVEAVKEMMLVLPPIFILLGLLDVWVPRQTLSAFLGEDAGFKGVVLAYLLGSAAAGPLYGAFPVSAVFLRKGASLFHIFIFIGAWSMTKIPMLLFEMTSLGLDFMLTRLIVNIIGIYVLARIMDRMVTPQQREDILQRARNMTEH